MKIYVGSLMKKIFLISPLIVFVAACGPSRLDQIEEAVHRSVDACYEMGEMSEMGETVGFEGPLKRLEIMKNYGVSFSAATKINSLLEHRFELADGYAKVSFESPQMNCMIEAISCQSLVFASLDLDDPMKALEGEIAKVTVQSNK